MFIKGNIGIENADGGFCQRRAEAGGELGNELMMTECQAELALALRSALILAIPLFFSPRLEFSSSSWLLHCVCATITFHSLFLSARAQNHNHTHTHAHMRTCTHMKHKVVIAISLMRGECVAALAQHRQQYGHTQLDFLCAVWILDYSTSSDAKCHSAASFFVTIIVVATAQRVVALLIVVVLLLTSVNAQFDRRVKLFIRCLCYGSDLLCLMC